MKIGDLCILDLEKTVVRMGTYSEWGAYYPHSKRLIVRVGGMLQGRSVCGSLGPSRMAVQCILIRVEGLSLTPAKIASLNIRTGREESGWWHALELLSPCGTKTIVSFMLRNSISISDAVKLLQTKLDLSV